MLELPNAPASTVAIDEVRDGLTWDRLVGSLRDAREALSTGNDERARIALASAASFVTDLYGEVDPVRTVLATHIQALLETCLARIEHARNYCDVPSVDATLQLLLPVRAALKPF